MSGDGFGIEDLEQEPSDRQRSAKIKSRERKLQDESDTVAVMSTRSGRRLVWRIYNGSGFLSQSFTGNSMTFFKEGRRSVGKQLYDELMDICPDLYAQMVSENKPKKERPNA